MGTSAPQPLRKSAKTSVGQKKAPREDSTQQVDRFFFGSNSQAAAMAATNTVTCHICWNGGVVLIPANERLTQICAQDRTICVECLQQYIKKQVVTRQVYDGIPCICTEKSCLATLNHDEIQKYADKATFDTYNESMTRLLLESDPEYYKCANPGCQSGQLHPDLQRNQPMRCRTCQVQTCVTHRCLWHKGRTCNEYDRDQLQNEKRAKIIKPPDFWTEVEAETDLVKLHTATPEYTEVANFFSNALHAQRDSVQIVEISRLQNISLLQAYAHNRQTMKFRDSNDLKAFRINNGDVSGDAHERRWLFHGAPAKIIPMIVKQGFDMSYVTRAAYCHGLYFARDASFSIRYSKPDTGSDGLRYMFMCLVVVGDWSQGSNGTKKPCKKRNSNERFDSTVDNIHNPSLFVIYQDTRAYPDYLVTFKCTST